MFDFDPKIVTEWVVAGKSAIELLRSAWASLRKESDKDSIQKKIADAEDALKHFEGKLAKELGYKLCRCTFPPQIMLWKEAQKAHVCPNPECGRVRKEPAFSGVSQSPNYHFR
jgi:hypothetical protein